MCLDIVWTEEEKEKWLRDKPDIITGYKVVEVCDDEVWPVYLRSTGKYSKTNKMIKGPDCGNVWWVSGLPYKPYYHICVTKEAAQKWQDNCHDRMIFKCEIPKSQITTVGEQHDHITIVTKEFTFVEGDEYFKENKQCA